MEMEHQREVPLAERQTCRVVTGEGKGSAGLRMQDRDAWGNLVPAQAHRLLLSQKPPRSERLRVPARYARNPQKTPYARRASRYRSRSRYRSIRRRILASLKQATIQQNRILLSPNVSR